VAGDPPLDLVLTPLEGRPRTVREQLTTFHLVFCVVDPFAEQSAWVLPTARRVLTHYEQADCRVAWLVAGTVEEARLYLGPLADDIWTLVDPDHTTLKGFGLDRLPALVHLGMDGTVVNAVEGWDPAGWKALTDELSRRMLWSRPVVPAPSDPAPFEAAPVAALTPPI
jgi:hypothetical protein